MKLFADMSIEEKVAVLESLDIPAPIALAMVGGKDRRYRVGLATGFVCDFSGVTLIDTTQGPPEYIELTGVPAGMYSKVSIRLDAIAFAAVIDRA